MRDIDFTATYEPVTEQIQDYHTLYFGEIQACCGI